ncbi:hypothetical protein PSR1_03348 [Anaeromyxobacter sp. PSR-1]|nr:hypothetical protein PSR1_03348 [Anaeromyxobacter sp. PSR-1]
MRVLYLHYGPQSGVTAAITRSLAEAGAEVVEANPAEGFLYQLRPGCRIPNVRPAVVRAVAEALRTHGRSWKPYYLHTTFAFDHLSARAGEAVRRAGADAVVQAGVLFSPGLAPEVPYHLYLDHTRAIAERYPPLDGLPPPVPYAPEWRAREEAVYRGAAGIFTMSEAVRASLLADYGVSPSRVHVVGAGPNVEPGPRDLGLAREPLVLFVGRNFVPKGGPELLEAFREVRRAHPRARLALVTGRAPAALPEGVTDHGLLGREALGRLYATAAVFALPTLRERSGSPSSRRWPSSCRWWRAGSRPSRRSWPTARPGCSSLRAIPPPSRPRWARCSPIRPAPAPWAPPAAPAPRPASAGRAPPRACWTCSGPRRPWPRAGARERQGGGWSVRTLATRSVNQSWTVPRTLSWSW